MTEGPAVRVQALISSFSTAPVNSGPWELVSKSVHSSPPHTLTPTPSEVCRAGCRYRLLLRGCRKQASNSCPCTKQPGNRITLRTETHGGEWGPLEGRIIVLIEIFLNNSQSRSISSTKHQEFSSFRLKALSLSFQPLSNPFIRAQPKKPLFTHKNYLEIEKECRLGFQEVPPPEQALAVGCCKVGVQTQTTPPEGP